MTPKTFRCSYRGCIASYQRKMHLRRHEKEHHQQALQCIVCDHEFGRRDTLRKHMQTMHDITEPRQVKRACTHCRNNKIRCSGGNPCTNCSRRGRDCSLSGQREYTNYRLPKLGQDSPSLQPNRSAKESYYLHLYWKFFHPRWSFIHRSSFSEHETPLLIQSMVVLGLWISQEPNAEAKAIELHNLLGSALRDQANVWDAFKSGQTCNSRAWPVPTYQAILLHIIFAGLVKPCGALGLDLKPCLLPDDLNLLTRLVASCKRIGMLYYPNMLFGCSLHDVGPFNWVIVEEVKHFNLALFKVWKTFGKSSKHGIGIDSLQAAGSADWGLGPHDLQFPLPKNVELWNAKSKEEWLAIGAEKMEGPDLNDTLVSEWISNSAEVLEGIGI